MPATVGVDVGAGVGVAPDAVETPRAVSPKDAKYELVRAALSLNYVLK